MSKSHAAARVSDQPTFAQLKELMGQIESGRITKDGLQRFLRGNSPEKVIEPDSLLDLFLKQFAIWQKNWRGKEVEMASRLLRFLPGSPPLTLRPAAPDKWAAYHQAIYWQTCNGVTFVRKAEMCVDTPSLGVDTSFATSLFQFLEDDIERRLSSRGFDDSSSLRMEMMFVVATEKGGDLYGYSWSLGSALEVKYEWCSEYEWCDRTCPLSLLDETMEYTFRVVASLLTLNEHVEDAYTLLDMWGSGNYPIGFDENDRLIVLTA